MPDFRWREFSGGCFSVQRKTSPINWSGYAFFLVCVVIVEILARMGALTSYVPPPSQIFVALWQGLLNGDISSQIGITLWVYVQGLALATVVSILVGILMGTYKPVYDALKVIVEFLRPVPSVAMLASADGNVTRKSASDPVIPKLRATSSACGSIARTP